MSEIVQWTYLILQNNCIFSLKRNLQFLKCRWEDKLFHYMQHLFIYAKIALFAHCWIQVFNRKDCPEKCQRNQYNKLYPLRDRVDHSRQRMLQDNSWQEVPPIVCKADKSPMRLSHLVLVLIILFNLAVSNYFRCFGEYCLLE